MRFVAVLNRDGGTLRTTDLEAFSTRMRSVLEDAGHTVDIRVVEGADIVSALEQAAAVRTADVVMAGGGGKNPKQLTPDELDIGNTIVSPDNKTIYFTCRQETIWKICKTPMEGGNVEYVAETNGGAWAISPDTTKLAYCFLDPVQKRWRTSLRSLNDSKVITTFDFGSWAYIGWTADNQSIIYTLNDAKLRTSSLMSQPISGGPSKEVLTLQSDEVYQAAWSPDSKNLIITRGKLRIDSVLLTLKK